MMVGKREKEKSENWGEGGFHSVEDSGWPVGSGLRRARVCRIRGEKATYDDASPTPRISGENPWKAETRTRLAAPGAPSELGQSWPELITAAVLLFVPPPQDGAVLARYIKALRIYRLTYIVHLYVSLPPRMDRPSSFLRSRNFLPSGSSQPSGSFATALPFYIYVCVCVCFFLLLLSPSFFPSFFFCNAVELFPRFMRIRGDSFVRVRRIVLKNITNIIRCTGNGM